MVIQIVRRPTIVYNEGKADSEKFESDTESGCEKFEEETEIETKECYLNSVIGIFEELAEGCSSPTLQGINTESGIMDDRME